MRRYASLITINSSGTGHEREGWTKDRESEDHPDPGTKYKVQNKLLSHVIYYYSEKVIGLQKPNY